MRMQVFFIFVVIPILAIRVKADVPLERTPCWVSAPSSCSHGIAFGDMNNDDYPDLAVANDEAAPQPQPVYVYKNINGELETEPSWISSDVGAHVYVAWGDVDKDGYLDLAVCGVSLYGMRNQVYFNHNGELETTASWVAQSGGGCWCGFGDMNGDGWLDLATVDLFGFPAVYLNRGGVLESTPSWGATDYNIDMAGAWGDMNGDGRLDLAVGNINWACYNRVYINQDTVLESAASWRAATPGYSTVGVAWADVNEDGWLDLACGNDASAGDVSMANILFLNHEGILETSPSWVSSDLRNTCAIAFADVDGDGDMDLGVANGWGIKGGEEPNAVYLNQNGTLETTPSWTSSDSKCSYGIAWADVDRDGISERVDTLDGNGERKLFYITRYPAHSIDSVVVDGVAVSIKSCCYDLSSGWVSLRYPPSSGVNNILIYYTYSIDLDLAVSNNYQQDVIYRNTNAGVEESSTLTAQNLKLEIYPNPYTQFTVISCQLLAVSKMWLKIYDISGRLVNTIVDGVQTSGHYSTTLDANGIPYGIYFLRLETEDKVITKKMMVVK